MRAGLSVRRVAREVRHGRTDRRDRLGALNVNGGAIALGHPVGSSAQRLVTTLLREMRRRGTQFGLATLCIGGGQGGAVVVELLPA